MTPIIGSIFAALQVDCSRGPSSDRKDFTLLLKELNAAFEPKGLLLSAAVSAGKQVIDVAYDAPALVEHLDWIGVMSYDYHGPWEPNTGHTAPLYRNPEDPTYQANVNFSITYWIQQGVPASKLVMGVPSYGQSYTLSESPAIGGEQPGLNAAASGPGQPGEFTKSAGILAYFEVRPRFIFEIGTRRRDIVVDPFRWIRSFRYARTR